MPLRYGKNTGLNEEAEWVVRWASTGRLAAADSHLCTDRSIFTLCLRWELETGWKKRSRPSG